METKVAYVAERLQVMVPFTEDLYKEASNGGPLAESMEQYAQQYLSNMADEKWPGKVGRIEYDAMEYRQALVPYVSDETGNDVKVPEYTGIMYAKVWVAPE